MKQTPIYHKEDPTYRVVYRPHSRWFVQFKTGDKATREFDPWKDVGKAKDNRDEAIHRMYERVPLKPRQA